MPIPATDYDSPWKEVFDYFFENFLLFFFPNTYAAVDWAHKPEFLDKELQKIAVDAATGRRIVDKLVKFYLKSGDELWILVHYEVQGSI